MNDTELSGSVAKFATMNSKFTHFENKGWISSIGIDTLISSLQLKIWILNRSQIYENQPTVCKCKNYGSSDQLMFIGCSGSNHSAFYLYRATNAGLSCLALVRKSPYPAQEWKQIGHHEIGCDYEQGQVNGRGKSRVIPNRNEVTVSHCATCKSEHLLSFFIWAKLNSSIFICTNARNYRGNNLEERKHKYLWPVCTTLDLCNKSHIPKLTVQRRLYQTNRKLTPHFQSWS